MKKEFFFETFLLCDLIYLIINEVNVFQANKGNGYLLRRRLIAFLLFNYKVGTT